MLFLVQIFLGLIKSLKMIGYNLQHRPIRQELIKEDRENDDIHSYSTAENINNDSEHFVKESEYCEYSKEESDESNSTQECPSIVRWKWTRKMCLTSAF